jgi:hypothetical protein
LRQSQSFVSGVTPRFRTMFANFFSPGSLRTVVSSLPVRYSTTSVSIDSPLTSEKPASSTTPSMVTRKLNAD